MLSTNRQGYMVFDIITWNFWPGEDHIHKYKTGTETRAKKERETESHPKMDGFDLGRGAKKDFLEEEEWKWKSTFLPKQTAEGK